MSNIEDCFELNHCIERAQFPEFSKEIEAEYEKLILSSHLNSINEVISKLIEDAKGKNYDVKPEEFKCYVEFSDADPEYETKRIVVYTEVEPQVRFEYKISGGIIFDNPSSQYTKEQNAIIRSFDDEYGKCVRESLREQWANDENLNYAKEKFKEWARENGSELTRKAIALDQYWIELAKKDFTKEACRILGKGWTNTVQKHDKTETVYLPTMEQLNELERIRNIRSVSVIESNLYMFSKIVPQETFSLFFFTACTADIDIFGFERITLYKVFDDNPKMKNLKKKRVDKKSQA